FPYAQIIAHDTLAQAEEALRDAKLDALFGDSLNLVYWTEGEVSQHCCRLLRLLGQARQYGSQTASRLRARSAAGERRVGQDLPQLRAGGSVVSDLSGTAA